MTISSQGDSGGPLMVLSKATSGSTKLRATLIGTLVAGPDAEKVIQEPVNYRELVADPGVYTRIDHLIGWIKKVVVQCSNERTCTII